MSTGIGWTDADAKELRGIRIALRDIADVMLAREVSRMEEAGKPDQTCQCGSVKAPERERFLGGAWELRCVECSYLLDKGDGGA